MTGNRHATITGTGSALPDRIVPNSVFGSTLDTSDEWIRERTGIGSRRFLTEELATSDLATAAGARAMASAGLSPEQIGLLVVCTLTPDRPLPSTAVMVQQRLGLTCPAFDLNAACAGFSYGSTVATSMIESGAADNVLVIGVEVLSRVLNMTDRSTCVLFGDGAGAAVFAPSDAPGVMASSLSADGAGADLLTIPSGGSARTPEAEGDPYATKIHMSSGREVFKRAVVAMTDACRELLDKAGVEADDVSLLIAHQANARIITTVGERLGFGPDRAVVDIEEIGNTSAASIPIALDRAWRAGRIAAGDLVLLTSFGAGLAWGAMLLRWTADAPSPIEDPVIAGIEPMEVPR